MFWIWFDLKAEHDGLRASHDQSVQQINDNIPGELANDIATFQINRQPIESKIIELTRAAANAFTKVGEAIHRTVSETKAADQEMQRIIAQIKVEVNNRTKALISNMCKFWIP